MYELRKFIERGASQKRTDLRHAIFAFVSPLARCNNTLLHAAKFIYHHSRTIPAETFLFQEKRTRALKQICDKNARCNDDGEKSHDNPPHDIDATLREHIPKRID